MDAIKEGRAWLKDTLRDAVDSSATEQAKGVPMPPLEKEPVGLSLIQLPEVDFHTKEGPSFGEVLTQRAFRRRFAQKPLTLYELAFLLKASAGAHQDRGTRRRFAPSAGNRHSEETLVAVLRVEGLSQGIYRYLAGTHYLDFQRSVPNLPEEVAAAARHQLFAATAGAVFFWTVVPHRTEWRYSGASAKVIALDLGHVCQNLYLACEYLGLGTCATAAYDQKRSDDLLGVDGEEEFTVYLAPVGTL